MFDDLPHPDLAEMERILTDRLERVLEVEQEAAAIAARRLSTLRDRLLDVEDREGLAVIHTKDGAQVAGTLGVGLDHVEVAGELHGTLIPFTEIVRVDLR